MTASEKFGGRSFWRRLLLLGSALTLLSSVLWWTTPVQELSHRVSDSWFNLTSEPQPSSQVAVVLIDDDSLRRYGRWPWSRTLLADLVIRISSSAPRTIGFDVLLPEQESEAADAVFERALKNAGNVILVDKISGSDEGELWTEPLPRFVRVAAAIGHAQALLDSDGICRRLPLAELSVDGPRLAFAQQIAQHSDPQRASEFRLFHERVSGHALLQKRQNVEFAAPIIAPVSYRPRTRDGRPRFATFSAADVLNGRATGLLRGKTVLVGFGSSDIHDRLVTPVSGSLPTPGVEIHAHIVDAILSRRFLAQTPIPIQFAVLITISFLSVAAALRLGTWQGAVSAVAMSAALYLLGYIAFNAGGWSSDAGAMMLAALLALPVVQIEKLLTAERSVNRQLRRLRSSLEQSSSSPAMATGDVNWKLHTLEQLQSKIAATYEFEHALLESSHDRIAVFSDAGRLLFCNSAFQKLWASSHPSCEATLAEFLRWAANSGLVLDTAKLPLAAECLLDGKLWNLRITRVPARRPNEESMMLVMTDLQARMERDRTRTETLAFVTHELRTPLVSIQGLAEMMTRFPEKISAAAPEVIFRESRRLVALINSYLDVLRLDSGARPLRMSVGDANSIAQHVVRVLGPLADSNQARLTAILNADTRTVLCDEALLTGALMNLASNAIKYGGNGAEVRISVLSHGRDLIFSVWNSGPAIPEADLECLFNPFFRGDADRGQKPGWGLGLAFVKRMVDQHHGNISVQSTDTGGTEFRIILPGAICSASRIATQTGAL